MTKPIHDSTPTAPLPTSPATVRVADGPHAGRIVRFVPYVAGRPGSFRTTRYVVTGDKCADVCRSKAARWWAKCDPRRLPDTFVPDSTVERGLRAA